MSRPIGRSIIIMNGLSVLGWAENEVYAGISPSLLAQSQKERRARGDRHRKAADFRRAHRERNLVSRRIWTTVIGPGLDNKDSSKAALVRRGMEAFGGSVVMVGDRRFDIEGGRANGVDTVGVCYGYGSGTKSWFPPMRRTSRIPWRN